MVEYALNRQWPTDRLNALWHLVVPELDHGDLAHDWLHVTRVTEWAIRLAEQEHVSIELAGAAGMLHDIINIPKESEQRSMGSELSAQAGVRYLVEAQFQPNEVTAVTDAISTCSWSSGKPPTSRLGAILQDADRLDAIGALGFMRNIACAQAMRSRGNPGLFYHPERPVPFNEPTDALNDKAYAIDHFFRKLQHLSHGMHTTMAKSEAHRRHQWMLEFLNALSRAVMIGLMLTLFVAWADEQRIDTSTLPNLKRANFESHQTGWMGLTPRWVQRIYIGSSENEVTEWMERIQKQHYKETFAPVDSDESIQVAYQSQSMYMIQVGTVGLSCQGDDAKQCVDGLLQRMTDNSSICGPPSILQVPELPIWKIQTTAGCQFLFQGGQPSYQHEQIQFSALPNTIIIYNRWAESWQWRLDDNQQFILSVPDSSAVESPSE